MKFILDENVSTLIDGLIQSLGHNTLRLPSGTKDKDLWALASRDKWAIVTHDQDFAVLSPSKTEGVLLVRIHPVWSDDVSGALKSFLSQPSPDAWRGKLALIQRDGFVIMP